MAGHSEPVTAGHLKEEMAGHLEEEMRELFRCIQRFLLSPTRELQMVTWTVHQWGPVTGHRLEPRMEQAMACRLAFEGVSLGISVG